MTYFIRNVSFHADGVSIDYASPESDQRSNGLIQNHVIFFPATDEYAELLDSLVDAAQAALVRGLRDWSIVRPPEPEEEDEDARPFDNPLERGGVLS